MYKLKLTNFEGPFDLLLYFIKRDELNIYDIPIASITAEFLKYIRIMQQFDLELAGEFLVMATSLMYIKTQMLLPREEDEEGNPIEDPRTQLVQKLLEYKRFKEASMNLQELESQQRYVLYRTYFDEDKKNAEEAQKHNYANAGLFDLLKAFGKILERKKIPMEDSHVVSLFPMTVEEKAKELIATLKKKPRLLFSEYTDTMNKPAIIVTFLALLDLFRKKQIKILQDESFEEIIIIKSDETNPPEEQNQLELDNQTEN